MAASAGETPHTLKSEDLTIMAHFAETPSGRRYWYDVGGDLDSCGHRHETRIDAAACRRTLVVAHHIAEGCHVCSGEPTAPIASTSLVNVRGG
jgi:hypothetical protein